jgi:hypothetical protein
MNNYSPWPDPGKWYRVEFRKGTWMLARPWYGAHNVQYQLNELTWLSPITFWFPFISVFNKYFHFYIGWKPIPPHVDNAFYWNKLWLARQYIREGRLFVQLSARWGLGEAR